MGLIKIVLISITVLIGGITILEICRSKELESNTYVFIRDMNKTQYTQDTRTNLCFAFISASGSSNNAGGVGMSTVPCSPEVLKLVIK